MYDNTTGIVSNVTILFLTSNKTENTNLLFLTLAYSSGVSMIARVVDPIIPATITRLKKESQIQLRGPESSLITWSPNKVVIRVLQHVLLCVPVSIGWHHCRTQYVIGPRNWGTTMWPATIGWWRRVSPTINTTQAYPSGLSIVWFFES